MSLLLRMNTQILRSHRLRRLVSNTTAKVAGRGGLRVLVQTLPLLIALAVFTEGFLLDRLKVWERVMAGISAFLFGAAVFTPGFLGVFSLSFLGIFTAAIPFYSQTKRVKMDKVKLAVQPF